LWFLCNYFQIFLFLYLDDFILFYFSVDDSVPEICIMCGLVTHIRSENAKPLIFGMILLNLQVFWGKLWSLGGFG
jgi:hypothetical protein